MSTYDSDSISLSDDASLSGEMDQSQHKILGLDELPGCVAGQVLDTRDEDFVAHLHPGGRPEVHESGKLSDHISPMARKGPTDRALPDHGSRLAISGTIASATVSELTSYGKTMVWAFSLNIQ